MNIKAIVFRILSFSLLTIIVPIQAQDDFSDENTDGMFQDGQKITISGTVKDASTGEGLAGANIVVEGTDIGSASDVEGSYTIE